MVHGEPWGSGIKLTQDWDMEVDKTGDVAAVHGLEELGKDLAFRTARRLDAEVGDVITTDTLAQIKTIARSELRKDARVERVSSIRVEEESKGEVRIYATVISPDQEYDLVTDIEV